MPVKTLSMTMLALLAGAIACGSDRSTDEIPVATVTRCPGPQPAGAVDELPFEGRRKEFFSKHPVAQLMTSGGRQITSPRIVGVYFGADKMYGATEALLDSYGCSADWRAAVNEYGIGDAAHDHSVSLAAWPGPSSDWDVSSFESWLTDSASKNVFGGVSADTMLVFLLPPATHLSPDDCGGVLGRHGAATMPDGTRIAYAYILTCRGSASAPDLALRTHSISHELMEMTMNPDPSAGTWYGLGPGIVLPSVRTSSTPNENEGADYCNDLPVESTDYPFEIARNYSNRSARAGRDPCDVNVKLGAVVAPAQGGAVDLSSGHASITLDVFAEDSGVAYNLRPHAELLIGDGVSVDYPLMTGASPVARDGESPVLDLTLTLPWYAADDVAKATRRDVVVSVCPADPGANPSPCTTSRIPISGLPKVMPKPDEGGTD